MLKYCLPLWMILFAGSPSYSQTSFSNNPDSSIFLTKDIDHFWKAFDIYKKDTAGNPFGSLYIDLGSAGLKGFIPNRIISADNLLEVVRKRRRDYENVRALTLQMKEKEKQCRSAFYALKYWYPEAQYPPVYFVIGAYNSGGTFSEDGVIIGAEKQTDINNIPYIVAHELIHFQQKNWAENPTLLQQSIVEGTADFLGELISGVNTNQAAMDYGNKNEEKLCREFLVKMDSTDYTDWLYAVSGKDGRPNDLGYWMGYKITEQYFRNSIDKKQAIREILDIKDYKAFLNKSGFLKKYIGQATAERLEIHHLTGDFYIYTTYGMYRGNAVPANGMYLVTSQGAVLFDTPWDTTQFQPLLDSIKVRHNKKVITCIATHFHEDRTNGLEYYRRAGIKTYTTRQTDDSSRTRNERRAEFLIYKDTVFKAGQYSFQTYYAGPGHTADNIVIWFEREKILYGGCLVKSVDAEDLGNLGDANVKEWGPTIRRIQIKCRNPEYIIPGHDSWTSREALTHTLELINSYKGKINHE
jgi:glyoxylase-like metal-dependent hydrolase (beta-lactamase superfamily II)